MGDRDPRRGGDGSDRGDARHDLDGDVGLDQGDGLLPAPAEDVRVATLEPHDVEPFPPEPDEQLVDLGLREILPRDAQGVGRRLVDELRRDETVVDHRVAGPEPLQAAHGDQTRVAGACADERDRHPRRSSTSSRKKSRRAS